jgi:hypothetical protein
MIRKVDLADFDPKISTPRRVVGLILESHQSKWCVSFWVSKDVTRPPRLTWLD